MFISITAQQSWNTLLRHRPATLATLPPCRPASATSTPRSMKPWWVSLLSLEQVRSCDSNLCGPELSLVLQMLVIEFVGPSMPAWAGFYDLGKQPLLVGTKPCICLQPQLRLFSFWVLDCRSVALYVAQTLDILSIACRQALIDVLDTVTWFLIPRILWIESTGLIFHGLTCDLLIRLGLMFSDVLQVIKQNPWLIGYHSSGPLYQHACACPPSLLGQTIEGDRFDCCIDVCLSLE